MGSCEQEEGEICIVCTILMASVEHKWANKRNVNVTVDWWGTNTGIIIKTKKGNG